MEHAPSVFGYGSLVNRRTHAYAPARPATLTGWRRAWRYTAHREGPFLTAVPGGEGDAIDGLIAAIPGGDWAALDLREAGYDRLPTPWPGVMVYAVPDPVAATGRAPILLSYIDVVFQGFLDTYGPAGLARFVATTDGWDTPILDDRAAPRYPRAQALSLAETAAVDSTLAGLGARILAG